MILLIDNYDSFSYNLYQLVGAINPDIQVIRNDALTIEEIAALKPERIILSPGPGRPERAGIIMRSGQNAGKKNSCFGRLSGSSGDMRSIRRRRLHMQKRLCMENSP